MGNRTRKPRSERRQEIARAVFKIIGERGIAALTTTLLAEEIGVTSGALFRHFSSREEILREAVRYALVRIDETFPDPRLPPLVRLVELARNRVRLLGGDPGLAWLLQSDQSRLTLPEDAVQELLAMVDRSRRYLLDALRDGVSQGVVRDDIEPEILLFPVLGTVHALIGLRGMHRASKGGRAADPERVLDALVRMLAPTGCDSRSDLSTGVGDETER